MLQPAAHREAWQAVFTQRIPGGPTTRGFDEYFGTDVPNWPPYGFIENDRTVGVPTELLPRALLENHQASLRGPQRGRRKPSPRPDFRRYSAGSRLVGCSRRS